MVSRNYKIRLCITTAIVIAILLTTATAAYAADTANISISIDGNITEYAAQIIGLLKEPIQVAINYLTSFLQYFAGWLAAI